MKPAPGGPHRVMIVDDTPANLELLTELLEEVGYNVTAFPHGGMALRAVEKIQPHLILLDIMMPEPDGFEVCRELKQADSCAGIPIIFISALSDSESTVRAFREGGVDYVIKPFQREEVLARVSTHLEIAALRNRLEQTVEHRTQELVSAHQQLSEAHARLHKLDQLKDGFLGMISHELRTPAHGILGSAQLIIEECDLADDPQSYVELFRRSSKRLLRLIEDASTLGELSSLSAFLPEAAGRSPATAPPAAGAPARTPPTGAPARATTPPAGPPPAAAQRGEPGPAVRSKTASAICGTVALAEVLGWISNPAPTLDLDPPAIELSVDPTLKPESVYLRGDAALLRKALSLFTDLASSFSLRQDRLAVTVGRLDDAANPAVRVSIELDRLALSASEAAEFFRLESNVRGSSYAQELALGPVVAEQIFTTCGGSLALQKGTGDGGTLDATLVLSEREPDGSADEKAPA